MAQQHKNTVRLRKIIRIPNGDRGHHVQTIFSGQVGLQGVVARGTGQHWLHQPLELRDPLWSHGPDFFVGHRSNTRHQVPLGIEHQHLGKTQVGKRISGEILIHEIAGLSPCEFHRFIPMSVVFPAGTQIGELLLQQSARTFALPARTLVLQCFEGVNHQAPHTQHRAQSSQAHDGEHERPGFVLQFHFKGDIGTTRASLSR